MVRKGSSVRVRCWALKKPRKPSGFRLSGHCDGREYFPGDFPSGPLNGRRRVCVDAKSAGRRRATCPRVRRQAGWTSRRADRAPRLGGRLHFTRQLGFPPTGLRLARLQLRLRGEPVLEHPTRETDVAADAQARHPARPHRLVHPTRLNRADARRPRDEATGHRPGWSAMSPLTGLPYRCRPRPG